MGGGSQLQDVLIFLLAAVVVVSIFRYLRASSVIGYLIAGTIIGPYALGFIDDIEGVKDLGHIGVVFLLFAIGLKMPLQRLQLLRRYVFGLGMSQVLITTCLFTAIVWFMGYGTIASIIVGSGLALSSTAVVLQVLGERGETNARFGRVSFSVLLAQDLAVVVFLVLLYSLDNNEGSMGTVIGLSALKAITVLVGITLIGRIILRPLFRVIAGFKNQELFVSTSLLVVLSTAVLTAQAGLSMELGAFLAGMLLSETEYRHQVEADIQPFHGLLMGLFFMSVGMGLDLQVLAEHPITILNIILSMMVLKGILIYGLTRLFQIPSSSAMRVALLLAGGGEFVFILLTPAIEIGFVPVFMGNILFVAIAISMGLTPLMGPLANLIERKWDFTESDANLNSAEEEIGDLRGHIIIAGFGRVGRIVGELLSKQMIPFVTIDNDMSAVSYGRSMGYAAYFGDARRAMVMRTLGIERAKAVVVCMNDQVTSMRTTMMLRRNFPNIETFVRLRDDEYEEKLTNAGATVVMPENLEPSLQLTAQVLINAGRPEDEVTQTINEFRSIYRNNQTDDDKSDDADEDGVLEDAVPQSEKSTT